MSRYITLRAAALHDHARPHPHIAEIRGIATNVRAEYIDGDGQLVRHAFRVIVRVDEFGFPANVSLARSGKSISKFTTKDYRAARVRTGSAMAPKRLAQACVDRIGYEHGREAVAKALWAAETAGPVPNPEHGITPPRIFNPFD